MISIHALREEGDKAVPEGSAHRRNFYPRPPRGGRLCVERPGIQGRHYFYPRPPRGGRLRVYAYAQSAGTISIHALREEGDTAPVQPGVGYKYFYPRPPRGGRQPGRCI